VAFSASAHQVPRESLSVRPGRGTVSSVESAGTTDDASDPDFQCFGDWPVADQAVDGFSFERLGPGGFQSLRRRIFLRHTQCVALCS
jgi:hypothetical protein